MEITKKDLVQKILREVAQNNAFYFFNDINEYTGRHARSLVVFFNKLKTINKATVDFHFKRRDFENWIRSTIGDTYLANEIAKISESVDEEDLLTQICQIIEKRLKDLKQFLANDEPYIEHDDDL